LAWREWKTRLPSKPVLPPRSDRVVVVNDQLQSGYKYQLVEPIKKNFASEFEPQLTPPEMLWLGVFGGLYLADCQKEFPRDWFTKAKLTFADVTVEKNHDAKLNYFGVNASQPLRVWQQKGWIDARDPRGWFQWYCRYYMGRRLPDEDERQIGRWKAMARHVAQIRKNCAPGDRACRRVQRQALLHWAYDSRYL